MEHKTPKTSSKVNNSNVSDISNWDSSVKEKNHHRCRQLLIPYQTVITKRKKLFLIWIHFSKSLTMI